MSGPEARAWRVPLQTGSDSVKSLWVGMVLLGWFVPMGLFMGFDMGGAGWLLAGFFLLLFGGMGLSLLSDVRRCRASDLVLDADGVRIDRGVHHGRAFSWDDLDLGRSEICKTPQGLTEVTVLRLRLAGEDGGHIDLARSMAGDEIASFHDVLAIVRGAAGARARPAATAATRPTTAAIVRCPRCGATCAPAETELVRCGHCGASAPMPADLRGRVHAARELDAERAARNARIAALVRDEPTARSLNRLVGASAFTMLVVTPFVLLVAGLYVVFRLGDVLEHAVSARRAFRALGGKFRAGAPECPGSPPRCRVCGSALPAADSVVVRCPFCESDNVVMLDLGAALDSERSADRELSAEIVRYAGADPRRVRRAAWIVWLSSAAATVALAGLGLWFLRR